MLIKHEKYDIVHVHGNSNTMAIELVCEPRLGGCKVRIAHSHNTTSDHMKVFHKILSPLFKESVTGCFACGVDAGKWLYPDKEFYVVNNGADSDTYVFSEKMRKSTRVKLNIKDEEILLGHIGGFNFQKNQELLVDVMALLDSRFKLLFLREMENLERPLNKRLLKREYRIELFLWEM